MNQEEYHKTRSFKEEYIRMLTGFAVEYDTNTCLNFTNREINAAPMGLANQRP